VGNGGDDAVVTAVAQVRGDLVVQRGGVGVVERDQGEIATGDEGGEHAAVAGAGDAGAAGGAAGARAGGHDDVAGRRPALPLAARTPGGPGAGGGVDQQGG